MLAWTCLGTQKEKKNRKKKEKKKKEIGNVTMKYLSLSWQASICLAYLPISSFILSFFLSFVFFVLQQGFILLFSLFCSKDLFFEILFLSFVFFVLQQGFILWNPIYSGWYLGISYEVRLEKKLKLRIIWKLP